MAESYVPIFFDWTEVTEELNAQEKGRLIDAIVVYARGGDWQEQIKGNERYLFPAFKQQIDRAREISKVRAEAGASGGKARGKRKQAEANATEENKNKNEYEDNNENKNEDDNPFADGDIRPSSETLESYIDNNLQRMTPGNWSDLESYRTDLPDELIRHAVDDACAHGARGWAYVKVILNAYLEKGFTTVGEVKAYEDSRQKRRQDAPKNTDTIGGKFY